MSNDRDTIKQVSHAVLDAVVTVMKEYPSIQLIEVQGHTDSRGSDAYNLDLSSRRVRTDGTDVVANVDDGTGHRRDRVFSTRLPEAHPCTSPSSRDGPERRHLR